MDPKFVNFVLRAKLTTFKKCSLGHIRRKNSSATRRFIFKANDGNQNNHYWDISRNEWRHSLERVRRKGTYVTSDVIFDDTLLLGDTASLATWGDAKGAGLGDGVRANGGIWGTHVLGQHGVLVQFSHSKTHRNDVKIKMGSANLLGYSEGQESQSYFVSRLL